MLDGGRNLQATIRCASEGDISSIMEVNMRTLPENYWYGFYKYILERWGDLFLVAEIKGSIVGYIMNRVEDTRDPVLYGRENELMKYERRGKLGVIVKSIRSTFLESHKVGHVISIAVLPEHRKKGIGSSLLGEAIRLMKAKYDVDAVYLEVRVSNYDAINLYEKFGFRKARIIRSYYRDGEDAYVMVKDDLG